MFFVVSSCARNGITTTGIVILERSTSRIFHPARSVALSPTIPVTEIALPSGTKNWVLKLLHFQHQTGVQEGDIIVVAAPALSFFLCCRCVSYEKPQIQRRRKQRRIDSIRRKVRGRTTRKAICFSLLVLTRSIGVRERPSVRTHDVRLSSSSCAACVHNIWECE